MAPAVRRPGGARQDRADAPGAAVAATRYVGRPDAEIPYETFGAGSPVTLFAHGLAGSVADTRPLGSGVAGRKVFPHLRGHGAARSGGASDWGYGAVAGDLAAVADAVGANRAVGVSLGAAALLRGLAAVPDRYERLVFFLPGALDRPRVGGHLGDIAGAGDEEKLVAVLRTELPAPVRDRPDVEPWLRGRAAMLRSPSGQALLAALAADVPVPDRTALGAVTTPALVLAQAYDPLHPVEAAEELAAALPDARLEVFAAGAALWTERARLRTLVSGFLND